MLRGLYTRGAGTPACACLYLHNTVKLLTPTLHAFLNFSKLQTINSKHYLISTPTHCTGHTRVHVITNLHVCMHEDRQSLHMKGAYPFSHPVLHLSHPVSDTDHLLSPFLYITLHLRQLHTGIILLSTCILYLRLHTHTHTYTHPHTHTPVVCLCH